MSEKKQPSLAARLALTSMMSDTSSVMTIPGTRHKVKIGFLLDCTVDKVTELLLRREVQEEECTEGDALMRSVAKHPYLNLQIAVCYVLNDYWKLHLFFPFVWRWWAYVWRLDESQVASILAEAQKKTAVLLNWYSMNLGYVTAIRADLKTMAAQSPSPHSPKSDGERHS